MTTNPAPLDDLDRSVLADIASHGDAGIDLADLTGPACDATVRLRAAGYITRSRTLVLHATDAGRAALAADAEPTAPVRITTAYAEDIRSRELAASYEGPANPYRKVATVIGGRDVEFTRAELVELHADAEHYCSPGGPGSAVSVGLRAAYRRVRDLARAALDSLPAERPPAADLAEALSDTAFEALSDLRDGAPMDVSRPDDDRAYVLDAGDVAELAAAGLVTREVLDSGTIATITPLGSAVLAHIDADDPETPGDEDADEPVRLAEGVELSPVAHEILLTVVGQPGILLDALDGDALRQLHDAELVTISAGRVGPTPLAVHLTASAPETGRAGLTDGCADLLDTMTAGGLVYPYSLPAGTNAADLDWLIAAGLAEEGHDHGVICVRPTAAGRELARPLPDTADPDRPGVVLTDDQLRAVADAVAYTMSYEPVGGHDPEVMAAAAEILSVELTARGL